MYCSMDNSLTTAVSAMTCLPLEDWRVYFTHFYFIRLVKFIFFFLPEEIEQVQKWSKDGRPPPKYKYKLAIAELLLETKNLK